MYLLPRGAGAPKSYLPDSPVVLRAARGGFDPYRQVAGRIKVYIENDHVLSKVDVVLMGGTSSALPRSYREWLVANVFKALNDFPE